jgi:hypothetical protein
VVIDILANDSDADGSVDPSSIVITAVPSHGTAVPGSDGRVSYTSSAGFSGTDSFSYSIKDRQGREALAAGRVIVTVQPSDQSPSNPPPPGSGGSNGSGGGGGAFGRLELVLLMLLLGALRLAATVHECEKTALQCLLRNLL